MFDYSWDFSFLPHYLHSIWKGILVTLELSFFTILLATVLGVPIGVAASRKRRAIRWMVTLIVDILRSIPPLVLILWVYYLLPMIGIRTDPLIPALVALILNSSVFIGDLIRAGLEGLPKGSALAGRALGMSNAVILKRIILPEVFKEIFPALTLMYISIIKLTSLASVIAVYEVTHIGDWIISTTFKPLEVYTLIALVYLIIVLPLTIASRYLESSSYFKRRSI